MTQMADVTSRARAGDEEAFRQLADHYRHELQVHCYRILGSAQDAEDALQETLLTAWRSLPQFEGRSSIRTWLYKIATTRCLNVLRAESRRITPTTLPLNPLTWQEPPTPARRNEVPWLEPYPDLLLEQVMDAQPGPEARYESREAISLAFITALQRLSPRQRSVLVLRDVLGFHAAEAAEILEISADSVAGALKRARATLAAKDPAAGPGDEPPEPGSPEERELVRKLTEAFAAGDVDRVVLLMTDDVWLTMPPGPFEYRGRDMAARGLAMLFGTGARYRLELTRANGQLAFGTYVPDPDTGVLRANNLLVLTLAEQRISSITRFDQGNLIRFGMPLVLDA